MGYKSRNNWRVGIDFCPRCHKVKAYCQCEEENERGHKICRDDQAFGILSEVSQDSRNSADY